MAIFEAIAIDSSGKQRKIPLEADSVKAAKAKIKKDGLILIDLKEKKLKKGGSGSLRTFFGSSAVSSSELAFATRQLASLIKANIPIVEALSALIDQTEGEKLKGVLVDIRQQVNEGTSLKAAISQHPNVFSSIYINMIESGEASGTLPLVLQRLADFSEAQVRLKNKVITAMTYPILMLVVGGTLMMGIFTVIIPKVSRVFSSMNKALPWYTEAIMNMSFFLKNYWWSVILGIFFLMYAYRRWSTTDSGRKKRDQWLLNAPLFGDLTRMIAMSRFASTMSTLLTGGVPLVTALGIVRAVMNNVILQSAVDNARENITEGQSISGPLKDSGEFPPLLIHMISIGERTGELPQMLEMVAENYEEQVNIKVERLTSLMEPLMMVFMGLGVGIVVMAVFVPLMQLNQLK